MSKEVLHIESFMGMSQSSDARDVPLQYASHCVDVDPTAKRGELRGRHADLELSTQPISGEVFAPIKDGTEVISFDGTWINSIINLPTLPSKIQLVAPESSGEGDMSSDGRSVRVALGADADFVPQWIGKIDHNQFNNQVLAPAGNTNYEEAVLRPYDPLSLTNPGTVIFYDAGSESITSASSSEETVFPPGYNQIYRASLEYDGYQNGPMSHIWITAIDTATYANGASEIQIGLRVFDSVGFPQRVTAVNMWRSYSPVGGLELLDNFRLVERIDINDSGWTDSSGDYIITFTDDGTVGDDWESITGLPDKSIQGLPNDTMRIHYQLSEMVNGFHFIANCWHLRIDQADNFIFRSLRNRPDMYNWAEDFLVLPTKPIALSSFLGKLYAFGEGVTYRIDPERLEVEQTIEGYGVFDKRSIVSTDRGMLFCNKSNIYLHNGVQIIPIGDPILYNDYDADYSWLGADHSTPPICLYDAQYDYFIVVYYRGGTSGKPVGGFVYSMKTQSWYSFNFDDILGSGAAVGGFIAQSGEPICSFDDILVHIAGNDTEFNRKSWKWVSAELHNNGEPLIPYWVNIEGDCNSLKYRLDHNDEIEHDFTSGLYSYNGYNHKVYINDQIPSGVLGGGSASNWGRYWKFRLELSGSSTQYVNSISSQIRRVREVTASVGGQAPFALSGTIFFITASSSNSEVPATSLCMRDLDGNITQLKDFGTAPSSMALGMAERLIFVSHADDIWKFYFDGSGAEIIYTKASAEYTGMDYMESGPWARYLYFSEDSSSSTLYRVKSDGTDDTNVSTIGTYQGAGVVIPDISTIYLSTGLGGGALLSYPAGGENVGYTVVNSATRLNNNLGAAYDPTTDTLWLEGGVGSSTVYESTPPSNLSPTTYTGILSPDSYGWYDVTGSRLFIGSNGLKYRNRADLNTDLYLTPLTSGGNYQVIQAVAVQ